MANKGNTTFGFMLANHPNRFGFYPVIYDRGLVSDISIYHSQNKSECVPVSTSIVGAHCCPASK